MSRGTGSRRPKSGRGSLLRRGKRTLKMISLESSRPLDPQASFCAKLPTSAHLRDLSGGLFRGGGAGRGGAGRRGGSGRLGDPVTYCSSPSDTW